MKALLTAKVGVFLVVSSVLAVWTFLVAQPVQAHTTALPTPTCSGLPADDFFTTPAPIVSDTLNPSITTQKGMGTTTRERLRYEKITIPALAAGELRVHSTTTPSDAVLCWGTSTRATSRTNYSAHNSATSAASAATNAADRAALANASVSSARSALRSAASALTTVANALTGGAATDATTAAGTARDFADDTANTDAANFENPLDNAATALTAAANALHAGFQIRAEVRPGDEEYVLVVAVEDATVEPTTALQFHGAIVTDSATAMQKQRQRTLNPGDQHTYPITVTTPGLLTAETTGSTDTSGMLSAAVTAMDDSSGSGDNFKIVAPVTTASYTVTVDGQTPTTTGRYTLEMDFEVAMQTGLTAATGSTVPTAPTWTSTGIAADDTDVQIEPSRDEDYFLLTIDADNSGFLTIEAMDDDTSATDAATTGTFYGPTGELAMDTNSGSDSSHFRIRAPVEEGVAYLVKVTGTTGVYQLSARLDQTPDGNLLTVPGAQNAPDDDFDCSTNNAAEICHPGDGNPLEIERYVFEVTESGALDVRTTGSTDTVGTLYGPNGGQIAADDNSGTDNNFRIAASVGPGLHLVEVRGKNRTTQGVFNLIVNFVPGAEPVGPTTPTTPTTPTIDPDPTGELEEPPSRSRRSGIGLVRGWVCQDDGNGVEIRIFDSTGAQIRSLTAPYGSARADVMRAGACDSREDDFGFAVQFNYNTLPAGVYTIQAWVGGEQVGRTGNGRTNTFTVVRIGGEFEERLNSDRIPVEDFPRAGQTTILEWDQSSQNFQIVDFE